MDYQAVAQLFEKHFGYRPKLNPRSVKKDRLEAYRAATVHLLRQEVTTPEDGMLLDVLSRRIRHRLGQNGVDFPQGALSPVRCGIVQEELITIGLYEQSYYWIEPGDVPRANIYVHTIEEILDES